MYEYGAEWTLTGPEGTSVVFNNGSSGLIIEEVTGFDSPPVRTNVEALPEADGGAFGNQYYGPRSWTISGRIVGLTAEQRNLAVASLQRASRALRGNLRLRSAPTGFPELEVTGRVEGFRITGGFVKSFLIQGISADPRIYSSTVYTLEVDGEASTSGATFPWVFPADFGGTSGATAETEITNAGNMETHALYRVWGPATAFQITNATPRYTIDEVTGATTFEPDASFYVDAVTLLAGEYVDVDTRNRTVTRNDGSSLYDRVRFPGSVWPLLPPGTNTIQLWGSGTDPGTILAPGTRLEVLWRDAWA
jgi:hypothetical protein